MDRIERFESIEIACWPRATGPTRRYAGTSHIDVANLSADEAHDLAAEIRGSGLVISGPGYYPNPLHPDPTHRAEAIGHLKHVITAAERMDVPFVIDPDGPSCNCGNHGCLEAFARADRIAEACGTETVEAAVEAARAGDAQAIAGLERVGRYLGIGIGIGNMITVISPDRVVIGGGIAAAGRLLLDPIRAEIARRVLTTALSDVEIVTAELGTWAGAIGAAVHGAEATVAARTAPTVEAMS